MSLRNVAPLHEIHTSASWMNSGKESRVTTVRLFRLERHVCHGRATCGMKPLETVETVETVDLRVGLNGLMFTVDSDASRQEEDLY